MTALDLLARVPLRAALRAEEHRDSVAIVIATLDGQPITELDLIEPGRLFCERRAIALNIVRRINRDTAMLEEEPS